MNKYFISGVNAKYEFAIDRLKIFIGSKFKWFDFVNLVQNYFNKISLSEYAKEYASKLSITIDDKSIDKSVQLVLINNSYDLVNEYKMTQKSLMFTLLKNYLENKEASEQINTINILIDDFINEIEEELKENNIDIVLNDVYFDAKLIINNVDISLNKDGFLSNQNDYNTKDLVSLKLTILQTILKYNRQKQIILIDELGLLTYDQILNLLNYDNLIMFIPNPYSDNLSLYYNLDRNIDYFDENVVYNDYLLSNKGHSYTAFKEELINNIKKNFK